MGHTYDILIGSLVHEFAQMFFFISIDCDLAFQAWFVSSSMFTYEGGLFYGKLYAHLSDMVIHLV